MDLPSDLNDHIFSFLSPDHAIYYFGNWKDIENPAQAAAKNGWLGLMIWCQKKKIEFTEGLCVTAALNGHWRLFHWLIVRGAPCDAKVARTVTKLDNFKMLKWLHGIGKLRISPTYNSAIKSGNLKIIRWINRHTPVKWRPYFWFKAMYSDNEDIRAWAIEQHIHDGDRNASLIDMFGGPPISIRQPVSPFMSWTGA